MSSNKHMTLSVNVRPQTLLALRRALRFYTHLAAGRYKVYDQPEYRFIDADHAVADDTRRELRELVADLEFRVRRSREQIPSSQSQEQSITRASRSSPSESSQRR